MTSKLTTAPHSSIVAHPQQTNVAAPSLLSSLPMFLAFGFMFYFLLIRPQNKKATEKSNLLKNLKPRDEVAVGSGIVGVIEDLDSQFASIKIAKDTIIKVQINAVFKLLPPGTYTEK